MRTNHANVTENAEFKIDSEKYKNEIERIFGPEPKKFCDVCDKRFSMCECPKEEVCLSVQTES